MSSLHFLLGGGGLWHEVRELEDGGVAMTRMQSQLRGVTQAMNEPLTMAVSTADTLVHVLVSTR